jgi:hypothetical protein
MIHAKIIKSKARIFGECINTYELLAALKDPSFSNANGPVTINTKFGFGTLSMVYMCSSCNKIHLVTGSIEEGEYFGEQPGIIIFADHTKDGKVITKKELIEILERIDDLKDVTLEHIGEGQTYTLTEIYKCNEHCPAVHLDCSYHSDCLYLN